VINARGEYSKWVKICHGVGASVRGLPGRGSWQRGSHRAHAHPAGDVTPSETDIKVTRDLIRTGQLLKIEMLDHVIIGHSGRSSLREAGFLQLKS